MLGHGDVVAEDTLVDDVQKRSPAGSVRSAGAGCSPAHPHMTFPSSRAPHRTSRRRLCDSCLQPCLAWRGEQGGAGSRREGSRGSAKFPKRIAHRLLGLQLILLPKAQVGCYPLRWLVWLNRDDSMRLCLILALLCALCAQDTTIRLMCGRYGSRWWSWTKGLL